MSGSELVSQDFRPFDGTTYDTRRVAQGQAGSNDTGTHLKNSAARDAVSNWLLSHAVRGMSAAAPGGQPGWYDNPGSEFKRKTHIPSIKKRTGRMNHPPGPVKYTSDSVRRSGPTDCCCYCSRR